MDPSGASRKTTSRDTGSVLVRHRRLVKQPSDPLTNASHGRRLGIKDLHLSTSTQDLTREKETIVQTNRNSWLLPSEIAPGSTSLRRLSQSGLTPGSEEFQSVLKDFIFKPEVKEKESKSQVSKTKCRKISFNEFGRASRFAKRLEDMSLSPRPKRSIDMLNAPTISSINRAVDHRKVENNGKLAQSRRSFPFSGIKEAWYESESSVQGSKSERRRHVSLPARPTGFCLDTATSANRQEESLVEPFRAERPARKKSNSSSTVRIGRKISTVVSPNFNMSSETSASASEPLQQIQSPNLRKCSSGNRNLATCLENENTEATRRNIMPPQLSFADSKKKQMSAGKDVHPNLLLGIKMAKQAGTNGELPSRLEKQFSAEDAAGEQHVAMKAHKNFKRIGKAALAARRFLKINESGTQKHIRGISPLVKDESQFEEMVEVMKSSYQDLCLEDSAVKLEENESIDFNQS